VSSTAELRAYFERACKPDSEWLLGGEHEMLAVYLDEENLGNAPAYDGPRGIRAIFERLVDRGWSAVSEGEHIIALTKGDDAITLEPGGQFELAAGPVAKTEDLETEIAGLFDDLSGPCAELGIGFLGVGMRPFQTLADMPWMPKQRYSIMREYLPTRGQLPHEMMQRTATVQMNIDFADVGDAQQKLRAIYSATPFLTAMFANSPVVDEQLSDFQSYRSHVWTDTDPDRCGYLPFVFEDGDVFDAYVQWAVDVPMFFIYRDDRYIPASGTTFRQFMTEGLQGHKATMSDWELHLSTLFPEARLKKFIEIRGCDNGNTDMILSLGPLSRGLFYDQTAREQIIALTAELTFDERIDLWHDVTRRGLSARVSRRSVREMCANVIAIATDGLSRQAPEEDPYLDALRDVVESSHTPADQVRDAWKAANGDRAQLISELAYPGLGGSDS